jgi:two-component SAPR family response regulator/tetratricopeptide (TPR) repeat protein
MNKKQVSESTDAWASLPETEARVDAMLEWVENNYEKLLQRAAEVCAEAEALSERLSSEIGVARAQCLKSILLYRQSRYDDARNCAEIALKIVTEKDPLYASMSCYVLGSVAVSQGENEKALAHYTSAYTYAEKSRNIKWITLALSGQGGMNFHLGKYEQAIDYYERSIAISGNQENPLGLLQSYANLAQVYDEFGDYHRALAYYFRALDILEDLPRKAVKGVILGKISGIYHALNDSPNALSYSLEALAEVERNENKANLAITLSIVGESYIMMNDVLSATRYFLRAQNMSESIHEAYGKFYALRGLAGVSKITGDTERAIDLFESALALAVEMQHQALIAGIHEHLAEVWQQKSNLETALYHGHEALSIYSSCNAKFYIKRICQRLEEINRRSGNSEAAKRYEEKWRVVEKELRADGKKNSITETLTTFEVEKAKTEARQYGMSETQIEFAGESIRRAAEERFKHLEQSEKETDTRQKIYVQTFGTFSVVIGGTEIPHNAWQRKKSRDIFKYLLIHYKKTITTDELADALWGETGKAVETSIQNAASALRKALEPTLETHKPSRFLSSRDKTYTLDLGKSVSIDFLEFKQVYAESKTKSEVGRREGFEGALAMYAGDFLKENLYDEWSAYERETMKDIAVEMGLWLSQHYALANNLTAAVDAAEKVLSLDATNEKAWQIILSSHKARGEETELQKQYKRCEHVFKKELGTPPPKSLQTLTSVRMKK